MTQTEQFLNEIESFLERTGMKPAAFGKAAVKDPSFVRDLRAGRSPSLALVDRVNEFMASHSNSERAA